MSDEIRELYYEALKKLMTRDELIQNMAFGIAAYFGENDDPKDAARAALAQIEAMGCTIVPNEPTEAMNNAQPTYEDGRVYSLSEVLLEEYRAMIAASPLASRPPYSSRDKEHGNG